MMTSLSEIHVAKSLSDLVWPHALVRPEDVWRPRGFLNPKEPELCETDEFLSPEICDAVVGWWLARRRRATTPVWDIAATCVVPGFDRKGVMIVEAKAHGAELSEAGKQLGAKTNQENHERIGDAITQANAGLNRILAGWNLTRDRHYQLSNRFAWAWKLAELGVPVVLVFLGFLNATEMAGRRIPFRDARHWRDCLLNYAQGLVPEQAWETTLLPGKAPLIPLIRSVDLGAPSALGGTGMGIVGRDL